MDDPEFRHILGDFLEAVERGEPAAFDRYANLYPRFAPALMQVALYAFPAEARRRTETTSGQDPAVAAGIQLAMNALGIASAKNLLAVRNDLKWSLGDLARHLLIPASVALKIERGQITTWPDRLTSRIAEVMDTTQQYAEAILRATAGNFRTEAAAFSAEGDPDIATVTQRRQETFDFEDVLAKERLTPEQIAYWKVGR